MWLKNNKDIIILSICIILYILNQIIFKNINILFFNNYFNDLLAVPLFFSLLNIISYKLNQEKVKSFKKLFLITILLSFLGEYVSLFLRKGAVFDYMDILFYFLGMLIYYIIIKTI